MQVLADVGPTCPLKPEGDPRQNAYFADLGRRFRAKVGAFHAMAGSRFAAAGE
jgi:hypothetical protein